MRVAYLNADCGITVFGDKGACVHIQEMIRALHAAGAEVRIVATRLGDTTNAPDGLGTGAVHAFVARDWAVKDGGRAAKEAANRADAAAARDALLALHATWPFDMIYERYSLWSMAGVEAARVLGVPLVVEVNAPLLQEQGTYRELVDAERAAAIERAVLTGADRIVTVSTRLRDYVIARGAPAERVVALGNAVAPERFHPLVRPLDLGLPRDRFTIGFTGSLKRWHGVDVMMEAFRLVRERAPDAHLLVVGDGPERGWIEGYARGARFDAALTMTGWLRHDRLPAAIAAMDVAIAPYPDTVDFYFSPLKLFEYLAVGRPIVASALGQIAEVLRDRQNGLLVPPGDPEALAGALLALRADPPLAKRLAAGAAEEGRRHTWRRNALAALALGRRLREAA